MRRPLRLDDLQWKLSRNNDNLHLIAITNLSDNNHRLKRWWCKKYNTPLKGYEDYTTEELLIEYLEDYYDQNRTEIDRFMASIEAEGYGEWDGTMDDEYEKDVQARYKKVFEANKADLSKWKSEDKLTEEQEKKLLANLGKKLPKSRMNPNKGDKDKIAFLGEDEFEDVY